MISRVVCSFDVLKVEFLLAVFLLNIVTLVILLKGPIFATPLGTWRTMASGKSDQAPDTAAPASATRDATAPTAGSDSLGAIVAVLGTFAHCNQPPHGDGFLLKGPTRAYKAV